MRHIILIFVSTVLINQIALAQNNGDHCQMLPEISWFDTTCYHYLENEILLGEGRVEIAPQFSMDVHVPSNRIGWAIAYAHGSQLLRNVIKKDYITINYLPAISLKETFQLCDINAQWAPELDKAPNRVTSRAAENEPLQIRDGCFQIDQNTGWPIFTDNYGFRFNSITQHQQFISEDNYETSAILRVLYDLVFWRKMETVWDWEPEEFFDNAKDPYAAEAVFARSYNMGHEDWMVADVMNVDRTVAINSSDILASHMQWYDYSKEVVKTVRILSNDIPTGSSVNDRFDGYYDAQVSWTDIDTYLDKMLALFIEANATQVKTRVKAKFDAINGGNSISYRYGFAPVVDEIVLSLPYYDAMNRYLFDIPSCKECIAPPIKIEVDGPTNFCQGMDAKLTASIGESFIWYKNGNPINGSITQSIVVSQAGEYSVRATMPGGCSIETCCPVTITTENCSSCSLSAIATSTNATCTYTNDGAIDVNATGGTGNYSYEWLNIGDQKQYNVPAGKYTVIVTEVNDPNCKAYASTEVGSSTINYQSMEITSQANCDAIEVEASIIDNSPTSCNYTLSVSGGSSWPDDFYIQTKVDNQAVLFSPVPFSEVTIPVNQASDLDLDLVSLIGDRWIFGPWTVSLKDANGNEVQSTILNQQTDSKVLFSNLVATCSQTVPQYDFNWNPMTNISIIDGNNISSAILSPSIKTIYRVSASSSSEPLCILFQDIEAEKEVCTDISSSLAEDIEVYPNPSSNEVYVKIPANTKFKDMQLFDAQGEEILNTTEKSLVLSGLPTGLYLLKIHTNEGVMSKKIIKN